MAKDFPDYPNDPLGAKRVDFFQIPVIDLAPLTETGDLDQLAQDINWALGNTGFMYVKNHGVTPGLRSAAFAASKAFFDLPLVDKLDLHIAKSGVALRGYTEIFGENTDPERTKDLKEVFDLGREAKDGQLRPFFGPNQWPVQLPEFATTLLAYHDQMQLLGRRIMQGIALSLGLPRSRFNPMLSEPVSIQRLLHYPSQQAVTDDRMIGIGAHTDYGCLTILAQDDVGGLQILNRSGDWIAAPPQPGCFVINIGDMMQRLTNDMYLANTHRVINTSGRQRYSMPFFFDFDFDTILKPLEVCISKENPSRYDPLKSGDYKWNRYLKSFPHLQDKG